MTHDIKDLKALFKLCRAQGITDFEMGDIKIKFGDLPVPHGSAQAIDDEDPTNPYGNFPQGELTPEQLAFYSAGGQPDNDPVLKKKGLEQ